MDDRLALRLRTFRDTGRVEPRVVDFVAAELEALADEGHTVTEETAGMLAGHLAMALTRLLNGDPPVEPLPEEQAAELAAHPGAVERARALAVRARRTLGAALPEPETGYLALHLAVLTGHAPAARRPLPEDRPQPPPPRRTEPTR